MPGSIPGRPADVRFELRAPFQYDQAMPTLRELNAIFYRHVVTTETYQRVRPEVMEVRPAGPFEEGDMEIVTGPREHWYPVKTLEEAHGVWFECPKCWLESGALKSAHGVMCWFVGKVPDDADPKPGRWVPGGTGIDDLTFIGPKSKSVALTSGCRWHGFVQQGRAE